MTGSATRSASLFLPDSAVLLTDLYQLTMAYGFWKSGTADKEAVYHLHFRQNPFRGGYTVAAGLETAAGFLESFGFGSEETDYLAELRGNDGEPLFEPAFLDYLEQLEFTCDVAAIPEGTVVFPFEPLLRISGPIVQCQVLETPLLNFLNFQTLIATKAARITLAAQGESVLEFGLRRAQGVDGALAASRAAFIGGCSATSNLLAGKTFGIPVKGTHAHSWVMSFPSELEAFDTYSRAMPNNCVFLVDTYDSLEGVRNAVEIGRRLRQNGQEMIGVRLDSGDLAYLSTQARAILDDAGFQDAVIVASNDLDEHVISSLKQQGAAVAVWGVGTKLITGYDEPALGGVYKMTAVREPGAEWRYKVKLSEQAIKISNPGIQQVRRFYHGGEFVGDMIFDQPTGVSAPPTIVDPSDMTRRKQMPIDADAEDLLVPIFSHGERIYSLPSLPTLQERAASQLAGFHEGVKRLINPHAYPVGLEPGLFDLRNRLILEARGVEL